MNIEEANI